MRIPTAADLAPVQPKPTITRVTQAEIEALLHNDDYDDMLLDQDLIFWDDSSEEGGV
jgi:hypothetical protein